MAWNSGYSGPHIDAFGDLARGAGTVRDMIAQAQRLDMERQRQAIEALHTKFQEEQSRRNGDLYERQIANSEATQKRMDRREKANAFMEYKKLMEAGDIPGAQAILRAYEMSSQEQGQEQAPQDSQEVPQQAQPDPQQVPGAADGGMDPHSSYAQTAGEQTSRERIPGVSLEVPKSFDDSETLGRNMAAVYGDAEARASQPGMSAKSGEAVLEPTQPAQPASLQSVGQRIAGAAQGQQAQAAKAMRKKFRILGEDGAVYAEDYDPEAARETALARQDEDRARQEVALAQHRKEAAARWGKPSDNPLAQNKVNQEIFALTSDYIGRGLDEKTALERAEKEVLGRMNAERPRGGNYHPPDPGGFKAADDAARDLELILRNSGYRQATNSLFKYQTMASNLAKHEPALDIATSGAFVKEAQGGTGVVSDSDYNVFWKKIGSPTDRVEDYVTAALSGKMGEAKRAEVSAAVKELAAASARHLEGIYAKAAVRMARHGENGQNWLDTMFGQRPENAGNRGAGGSREQAASERTVVRTGRRKSDGRTVVEYSDGTREVK